MNRIILIMLATSLMFSCSQRGQGDISERIVSISAKQSPGEILGVGMMIDNDHFITSAHGVSDERLSYILSSGRTGSTLSILHRDSVTDRAVFTIADTHTDDTRDMRDRVIDNFSHDMSVSRIGVKIGDPIFTYVFRSGSLVRLEGQVLEPNGRTLGYTNKGQSTMLSGVVLTDLRVIPGDSGAPVFTSDTREFIDVVHVAGE